jgi:hypothetical protein
MKTLLTILLAMTTVATMAVAADKPNFSGDWTLDAGKSDFGPIPAPQSMTRKVEHSDPSVSFTEVMVGGPQGDQTSTTKWSADGKETTNDMMGNPVKWTAKWDGDALVANAKADFQGNEITLAHKWTLSADGKVLTDAFHIGTAQGEFDITYVLNKK